MATLTVQETVNGIAITENVTNLYLGEFARFGGTVNDLTDVTETTPSTGDVLVYNSGTAVYENTNLEGSYLAATGITDGYVLTADGANGVAWEAPAGAGIGEFISTSIAISSDGTALANDDGTTNSNIGIGRNALNSVTTTSGNIAIGDNASQYSKGDYAVFIGTDAGKGTVENFSVKAVGIGYQALQETNGALESVCIGKSAGQYITTPNYNIGIGPNALRGDPTLKLTGASNVAVGATGLAMTTATNNCMIGAACTNLTTGGFNSAIGSLALRGNSTSKLTGSYNVASGRYSGYNVSTGQYNVLLGYETGYDLTSGSDNTFIGTGAGGNSVTTGTTTASNVTCIGHDAVPSSATVSNEITLGDSLIATLRCQVTSITALSDERDKDNIVDLDAGLDFVNTLRPVRFDWNMRDGGKVGENDTGFIAQELKQAQVDSGINIPHLVYESNPEKLEAAYGKLLPAMVKAIQELSTKVDSLTQELNTLKGL